MNALAWVLLGELVVAVAALALGLALAGRRRSQRRWAALETLLDGVAKGEKRRRLELQDGLESHHGLDTETAERVGAALYAEEKAFLRELVPLLAGGDPAQLTALRPALTTLMDRQLAVLGEAHATAHRLGESPEPPWEDDPAGIDPPTLEDSTEAFPQAAADAASLDTWDDTAPESADPTLPAGWDTLADDDTARILPQEETESASGEDAPWPEAPLESAEDATTLETWDAPDAATNTPQAEAGFMSGENTPWPEDPPTPLEFTDDGTAETPKEEAEPPPGEDAPSQEPDTPTPDETALLMAAWQSMMADDSPTAPPEPSTRPDPTHK